MDKEVLFVTDTSSFLGKTLQGRLIEHHFVCHNVAYDVNAIDEWHDMVSAIFLLVESDTVFNYNQVLVYLKDMCLSGSMKLFLIGDQHDIDEVTDIVTTRSVWKSFARPINVVEVSERISELYDEMNDPESKTRILVVDDSGTFLHTIKEWLEPEFRVDVVDSAINAISYLAKSVPDLVLLDYDMPVCNGARMLEMIRGDSKSSDVPVMFLTGRGDKESIERVLALKPQGYLLKSLPKEVIMDKLRAYFYQRDNGML